MCEGGRELCDAGAGVRRLGAAADGGDRRLLGLVVAVVVVLLPQDGVGPDDQSIEPFCTTGRQVVNRASARIRYLQGPWSTEHLPCGEVVTVR